MAQSNQELVVQIKADLSKLQKGLDGAEQKAKGFKNRLAKIGDSLKQALNFGAIFAGGAAVANAFNVIKDFEQATANLAAVTGKTTKEIQALTDNSKELGAITAFTASEVSGLQTELAKLGFREADILKLTKPILNLAQATGSDLANAAALAGSVVQSFGLEAKDTVKVVDIMTKSFTASALDIRKFEVGIRQVAPVAKNANVELSEVTAMLGVLANNGVRAESAGVGLRNVLLEAAKRGVPFKELLDQVNTSADKSATAMQLFGKENAAVGVILAENTGKANDLNIALQDSAGTAQEMADTQLDTLTGALAKTKSAWEGFILSLESGEGVIANTVVKTLTTVQRLLQTLGNLSNYLEVINPFKSITDYSDETKQLILDIGRSAESGEEYATVLAKLNSRVEAMDLQEFADNIGNVREEFESLLRAQGDDEETISALWDTYANRLLNTKERAVEVNEELEKTNTTITNAKTAIENYNKSAITLNYTAKQTKLEFGKVNHTIETVGVTVSNTLPLIEGFSKTSQQALMNLGYTSDEIANSFNQLVNVFQQGFQEIGRAAVQGLGLAETGLQGFLGVMIETAVSAIGVALAESLANGVLSSTKLAVSLGPAGLAALPLLIGGAISAVKAGFSKVPKFADGGIVNGSSFSGDRVMARVNSGEMILNRSQQANLFGMINGGGSGNNGVLTAQIKGSDIWLSNNRAGKERRRYTGR